MRILKRFIWSAIRRLGIGPLLLWFHPDSALRESGWIRSFKENRCVDRYGSPLPWYTYSAIEFLKGRINRQMHVFEYGCGNSTRWYAELAYSVIAVEDNPAWTEIINQALTSDNRVIFRLDKDEYVREIQNHKGFDIVVIDGNYRKDCFLAALPCLTDNGVVIWDDSNRDDCIDQNSLMELGFRRIDFTGMFPSFHFINQTSIFYRPNNCLGI
jgi:hypothetical protein